MNKKGKNKKGKVPNPPQEVKPSENLDLEVISDEQNPEKTSESVKEERVPEIISEVIPPPIESRDEESPKKPKRNRGKKKKGKEDDAENNLDDEPREPEKKIDLEEKNNVIEEVIPIPQAAPAIPVVTPSMRKKKNKNKVEDQKTEQQVVSALESDTILPEIVKTEPDIKFDSSIEKEIVQLEVKPSKKKNKKKKRNDSGSEEISCTSAFQKLMEAQDEALDLKIEDDSVPVKSDEPESGQAPEEAIPLKEVAVEGSLVSLKEMSIDNNQQPSAPESKGKKKNKKDKRLKYQNVEDASISKEDVANITQFSDDITAKDKSQDNVNVEKPIIVQETSPKPKAKIAKPVDKKRKGNQEIQSEEFSPSICSAKPISLDPQIPQVELEKVETNIIKTELLCDVIDKQSEDICQKQPDVVEIPKVNPDIELHSQDFEALNMPSETICKKRKKGSKVPKTPDVSFEILDPVFDTVKKQISSEGKVSTEQQVSEGDSNQEADEIIKSKPSELKITVLESEPKTESVKLDSNVQAHVLHTPEPVGDTKPLQDTLMIETKEDTQKHDKKSGKKRKKSPKPFQKHEHVVMEPTTEAKTQPEMLIPTLEVSKNEEEKVDASNITRIYDIEISSLKADESDEPSPACDTMPDVTYPRSVSQELMDNNNNNRTVIREIFPLQTISVDIKKQDVVIPPSVDAILAPKKTASPPKEEKTDIKSKMMEVNQDMEELRLSIERSLAELTVMEKNEEMVEKSCEKSRIITQEKLSEEKHDQTIPPNTALRFDQNITEDFKIEETKQVVDSKIESPSLILADPKSTTGTEIQSPPPDLMKSEIKKTSTENASKDVIIDDLKKPAAVETIIDISSQQKLPENLETSISPESNVSILQAKIEDIKTVSIPIEGQCEAEQKNVNIEAKEQEPKPDTPPTCPARKDQKNKNKKKKGKQDVQASQNSPSVQSTTTSQTSSTTQDAKNDKKTDAKTGNKGGSKDNKEKGKQQSDSSNKLNEEDLPTEMGFEPIENFEDALTSSVDDVNQTFDLIVKETQEQCNPKINITAPDDEKSPVKPPKNLLGHPDIPVSSNKRDYKKEKDKIPNEIVASVNIKDAVDVERKQSKNTQTSSKLKDLKDYKLSENEEYVYKYSFRKVFLQSSCHVCKKDLGGASLPCCYCNLVFYCCNKHKDEDWPLHQAFCFAVSTIGHLKDQKHIYADIKNITGQDYRLIRMQMIVSCEKVLKRRLVPWEQEALLYPRVCAHVPCREWRQTKLTDCQGCGQISYCKDNPDHYPKSHSRWCKSYSLYQKLVCYQQTKGRLEPRLPTKVMQEHYEIPEKINEVLAAMYEEKIDMNDIQYAALTQIATAPLTAAYSYQLYKKNNITTNGYKKSIFTIHVVGAELQFEADALNKWEVFFLHLRPDLQELRVVLINSNLNPSSLPLDLLGKIKLCVQCRQDKRRVVLHFVDNNTYTQYKTSEDFIIPDLVCAFNPSIQRSSVYNAKDHWPSTINVILKQKVPFIISAYTITELHKDCIRIKEISQINIKFICEPKLNSFASVRPDRNFITDDEMPLLFKNYCFALVCGA